MPAPSKTEISGPAHGTFIGFGTSVPEGWAPPPNGAQYAYTLRPGSPGGPHFVPASPDQFHTATQTKLNDQYSAYIDDQADKVASGWSSWQSKAALVGVVIAGPTASVGQVVGGPMLCSPLTGSLMQLGYSGVVSTVMAAAWLAYSMTIKVPGLPWYPAFSAFPGPVGAPTPNVPTPVIALPGVEVGLSTIVLAGALSGLFMAVAGGPSGPFFVKLATSLATGINSAFMTWKTKTQVMKVIGTGPIPTFAPPFVPVGPVVGGVGTGSPGCFT